MKAIPGTLQEGGAGFQTTHWTLVLRARETQSETSAQKALSTFCEAYWPPLYAFLRHRGHSSADAQDLVQGFFAHLLEQNTLTRADRQKGRLPPSCWDLCKISCSMSTTAPEHSRGAAAGR